MPCWTCGGDHCKRDCAQYQSGWTKIYSVKEAQTVGDVGQSIPHIYVALVNIHAFNQASIIDMDSKLCDQVVSILIDPRANYSYANPDLVDKCGLNKEVHAKSWLVELAIGTKKRVHRWVRDCAFKLNGMPTSAHLNVLSLGSYSMLLGMD